MHVTSLSGERLTLNTENGPQVDLTHNIIGADIPASNGVIHVIDSVIVPNWTIKLSLLHVNTTAFQQM